MKKVWQIISVVLVIALALSMTAFAQNGISISGYPSTQTAEGVKIESSVEDGMVFVGAEKVDSSNDDADAKKESDAVYAFSTASGTVGELVDINIYFKTGVPASVAAIGPIKYDNKLLEFVDFSYDSSVLPIINEQLSGFDVEKMALVTLFNSDDTYDICLGTLQFKIIGKPDAQEIVFDEARETELNARKEDVIALKINAGTAYAFGKTEAIDPDNSKVVPYLKNDRTLVPLRFVSETLGAEVKWEAGWNYCYVVKGDKEIKITFNSADIEVNGKVVTYDAPVEVVQDRTMVPIRFISEELGYDVKWNQANQLVIITPADNPWVEDRQVEKDVLEGVLVTFLFNGIF